MEAKWMAEMLDYALSRGYDRIWLTFHITEPCAEAMFLGIPVKCHQQGLFHYRYILEDTRSHRFFLHTENGIKELF